MIVTSRDIVMRQSNDAIARQSRTARGVCLQRLDASDAIVCFDGYLRSLTNDYQQW